MKQYWQYWVMALSIGACLLIAEKVHPQSPITELTEGVEEENFLEEEISINLPESVTLEQLMEIISRETNTLFMYQEGTLRGQLSITMPSNFTVKKKDLFVLFNKLLESQSLTLLRYPDSNVVELIEGREARFHKLPLLFDDPPQAEMREPESREMEGDSQITISSQTTRDRLKAINPSDYVIRVRQIKYADMNQIKDVIQPFLSQVGMLLTYDLLRVFIFVDSQVNVDRINGIIDILDVKDPEDLKQVMTVYKMKHTRVEETHRMVSSIYANILYSGRQEEVKFLVNARQNSLIFFTTQAATEQILKLLKLIDVEVAEEEGTELTVHPLTYRTPGSIAPLLSQIYTRKDLPVIKIEDTRERGESAKDVQKPKSVTAITSPVQIIPFDSLSLLIIIADPSTTQDILKLVEELDVPQGEFDLLLHPLKFASAPILGPLLANIFSDQIVAGKDQGQTAVRSRVKIIPEPRLNSLIIIADKFTIPRILGLIEQLDVSGGNAEFTVHPLQHAKAGTVAKLLNSIFSQKSVTGNESEMEQEWLILSDERLNLLIIFADHQRTERILNLIERLDLPAKMEVARSQFKLYSLQHAVAKEVASLLKEVTGNIVDVAKSGETDDSVLQSVSQAEAGKEEQSSEGALSAGDSKTRMHEETANQISITADETTNTLLVFGPTEIFATLDRIIEQLDIPRVQVYIEALIMETSLSKSLDFGVNWSATTQTSGGEAIISAGFPDASPLTIENALQNAGTSAIGVLSGGSLIFEGQTFLSFGAFVRAVQHDADINILANPQLMMLNNEEATLNVSRVVPVATKSVVDANGRVTDQIEFRDVGVIATIRPQISGDQSIRLEISQTTSDVAPTPVGSSNAVTTFKRELKTVVITVNDSIVVLGGLLNEQVSLNESEIPGLGGLPFIGWLFRSNSERVEKTNLMMFIRPTIIRSQQDLIRVTERANAQYIRSSRGSEQGEPLRQKSFRELLEEKESPAEQFDQ